MRAPACARVWREMYVYVVYIVYTNFESIDIYGFRRVHILLCRTSRYVYVVYKVFDQSRLVARNGFGIDLKSNSIQATILAMAEVRVSKQIRQELTAKQLAASSLIACGKSHAQVAKDLKCSVSLISKWAMSDEFKASVAESKRQIFSKCLVDLQGYASEMLEQLREIALNEENVQAKLRAIGMMMDYAFRSREIEGVERRLEVLESVISKSENPVEKIGRPDANLIYSAGRDDLPTLAPTR